MKKTKDKPSRVKNNPAEDQEEFPGYKQYPPQEDIMNSGMEKVSLDEENLFGSKPATDDVTDIGEEFAHQPLPRGLKDEDDEDIAPVHNESDVTEEDLQALGPKDLSMDMGEDELLKQRVWPVDFAGEDLDVPSEDADKPDALEQGDEENDHYSLGGDRHENLEDDPTAPS
jgi:hypothetical protein